MAYRDERETLERRVRVLEAELATEKEKVARLEGLRIDETHEHEPADRYTGSPRRVRIERTLPYAIDASAMPAIEQLFRTRLHDARSRTTQVASTLRHHWSEYEVVVTVADEETRIVAEADYANARWGLLLGGGCGFPTLAMPLGGLSFVGIVELFGLGKPVATAVAVVGVLMMVAGGMALFRALHRRHVEKTRRQVAGVIEAIPFIAERHRLRIEDGADAEAELEAELEEEAHAIAKERK